MALSEITPTIDSEFTDSEFAGSDLTGPEFEAGVSFSPLSELSRFGSISVFVTLILLPLAVALLVLRVQDP